MAAQVVEVIEHCSISPPLNSVPTTSIPITYFDVILLLSPPVQHILFYEFPYPTLHFTQNILPKLKHSLSLTLQHFFPLAGTFVVYPPQPTTTKPHILYCDDGGSSSSVPLIIAESKFDNFDHLVKNNPRDVRDFHPLVPELSPPTSDTYDKAQGQVSVKLLRPLIAIQVTIFPNYGISIGYTYRHVVGDGRSINHFLKSWASIFKCTNEEELSTMLVLPCHDRTSTSIKDTNELSTKLWNQLSDFGISWDVMAAADIPRKHKVLATFVMGRLEINKLRHWIASQQFVTNNDGQPQFHVSRFVVTCAFIWRCLIKAEHETYINDSCSNDNIPLSHFGFFADCRDRRNNNFCAPKNFFGNCIMPSIASVKRSELLSENGLKIAAKSIMDKVQELDSGTLRGAERWLPEDLEVVTSGNYVDVAWSPKFCIYDTDFGWGKPKKSEMVHIDISGSISLTEYKDEEGGIEVGLALSKVGMDAFITIFEHDLQDFMLRSTQKIDN